MGLDAPKVARVSERWGDVITVHPEFEGEKPWWCNECGAEWTRDLLVAWEAELGEYVCAAHVLEEQEP